METLANIDTWMTGLKYQDKFNHFLSRFKYTSNPVHHTIPTKYWTPYHNFESFRIYNYTKYEWLHRHIEITLGGYWPYY